MSAQLLLAAIYGRLYASSVWTTVGGRLGLDKLPADTALPLVVYTLESIATAESFGSVERYDIVLAVSIYQSGSGDISTHTISAEILSALTPRILPTSFDRLTLFRTSCGSPTFIDDCWTVTDRYKGTAFLPK